LLDRFDCDAWPRAADESPTTTLRAAEPVIDLAARMRALWR
jgi:hypothetical protein